MVIFLTGVYIYRVALFSAIAREQESRGVTLECELACYFISGNL